MFDVKRMRERAADWLGDVGDAALLHLNRVEKFVRGRDRLQKFIGREVWNKCHACGQLVDCDDVTDGSEVRCLGCRAWSVVTLWRDDAWTLEPLESEDEFRARIKATLARGEPCPGYHQDFEPCDLCAESTSPPEPAAPRIEVRDGVEWLVGAPAECDGCAAEHEGGGPCCHHLDGEHLAVAYPNSDGDCEILARWPIEPAGTSPPAGQDPAPHFPGGVQPVDGGAADRALRIEASYSALYDLGVGPARSLRCAEIAEEEAAGVDAERWHRALVSLVRTVGPDGFAALESPSAAEAFRTMLRDAARAPVKPPHNAEPGALGEAVRMHNLLASDPAAVAHLGGAVPNDPAPALAADIEEQRISHGGCTRLPREMLDALGVADGDLLWFLRSTPGGRWEAWTEADVGANIGNGSRSISQEQALRAAIDAMPFHVASRLTAGEARRLEANGLVPGVVWYHDNVGNQFCTWNEGDEDDLAHLREEASAAPRDRATPPVAGAAERVPESPSGGAGAPWRGIGHKTDRWAGDTWCTIAYVPGDAYGARFDGPHAEERAREYAALMSEPAESDAELVARLKANPPEIPGVPCGACGKPTSTGRCFGCTVARREPAENGGER